MRPGVAGGAEGKVGRAVGVPEIVGVTYGDRAVIPGGGAGADEGARLTIQLSAIAVGNVVPFALGVR